MFSFFIHLHLIEVWSIITPGDYMNENVEKRKKYEIDMCSGNLFVKILIFSLPLALMGILQLLYNTADLIVVGNFSNQEGALGAVGSTSALINLIVNLFMGLSVGTNVVVARLYGAKDYEKVGRVVHTSIFISFIIGVLLGVMGFFMAGTFLHLMHNDLELSKIYLQIYFIGMPFNMVYNFAAAILRAVGDTKRPLIYLSVAGIVNIILNLFFVIVCKMGVAGVAIATIISQIISCVLIMLALLKSNEAYRFRFKELAIYKNELWEITKIGLPAGIQGSIFSISNVIIQSSVNMFTPQNVVMDGNSAASSLEGFVYTAMNSVYHAALAFTGQNVGAKNKKNIIKVTIYSLIIVTMIGVFMGGLTFIFGKQLLRIYVNAPDKINVGYIRLHYLCLPYFLCGIMDVMVGVLRGLGYSTIPMIVSIIGVCGFRIAWIYLVFRQYTNFVDYNDLHLLYISYPISWIITFAIHLLTYFIVSKKVFNAFRENTGEVVTA